VCCLMIIADAIDNKHLYEEVFKDYYDWGEKLRREGLPESYLGPKLMPFEVSHTTDMKAAWYLSNKGGGCKTKNFFCHLCSCTRNSLVSYSVGDSRCDRCKRRNRAITSESKLRYDHMQANKKQYSSHIDFVVPANDTVRQ